MLLTDRVAIVSGIGPGMGRDISLAFARAGARLVLAARTPEKLESVAKEVEALGGACVPVPADVTRAEDCARVAEAALGHFGRIDVLVNNAFHGGNFTKFEDLDVDAYLTPFKVNALGSLRLTQAVLPAMKEQRSGSIVMINSMIIRDVLSGQTTYAASKGALLMAAQGLARELGPHGIRVNTVVPGYIWGPNLQIGFRLEAQQRGVDPQVLYDEVAAKIALGRIPTSEEIADAVLFFASDLSRVVTGQSLDVNGGHAMH
jgi:NAD(P)-dependent dehydrogenase (short-subunit alcohol dehydrogenase family)